MYENNQKDIDERTKKQKLFVEIKDEIVKLLIENNMSYGESKNILQSLHDDINNKGNNFLNATNIQKVVEKFLNY